MKSHSLFVGVKGKSPLPAVISITVISMGRLWFVIVPVVGLAIGLTLVALIFGLVPIAASLV